MILPGHLAAVVLERRHLRVDLYAALAGTLAPDVIDKLLYYVFHVSPQSRIPMHTLVGWVGSTVLVALLELILRRRAPAALRWRWTLAWFVGFGGHLLFDSPLAGGDLPILWPFRHYDLFSYRIPFSYLWGVYDWPVHMLVTEAVVVAVVGAIEWRRHGLRLRWRAVRRWWLELGKESAS
jgi:hypothetical protein